MRTDLVYPLHRYTIKGRTTNHFAIYNDKRKTEKKVPHFYSQEQRYRAIKNKIIFTIESLKPKFYPTHFFSLFYKPKLSRYYDDSLNLSRLIKYNKGFFRSIRSFYPNSWFLRTFDMGKKHIIHNHGVCYLKGKPKLEQLQEDFMFVWQQVTNNKAEQICTVSEYERGKEFYLIKNEKAPLHIKLCEKLGKNHFFSIYNSTIMEYCHSKTVLLDDEENEVFLELYKQHIEGRNKNWKSYEQQLCEHRNGRVCDTEPFDIYSMLLEAKGLIKKRRKSKVLVDIPQDVGRYPHLFG